MKSKKISFPIFLTILLFVLFVSIIICTMLGERNVPFAQLVQILSFSSENSLISDIIWNIRLPRVFLAIALGAGLSLAGVIMQATVQNPLADPYLLGISSGASFGATFYIMLGAGLSQLGISVFAFAGALIASGIVLLSSGVRNSSPVKLVLMGTVVNALCTALSNFLIYFSNESDKIRTVSFWNMGSLTVANWNIVKGISLLVMILFLFFITQSKILNALLLGEETALTLGINVSFYQKLYILIVSILTGALVSQCGIIGFVGLIIPHISRSFVGSQHEYLLPTSVLLGALFLLWSDTFARIIIPNGEMPIGILTALIGAPVFMYLMKTKTYQFGGVA